MKTTVMATVEVIWVMEDCIASVTTKEHMEKIADAIKDDLGADHVVITTLKDF